MTVPEMAFGEYWDTCEYTDGVLNYNQDAHRQRTVNWCDRTGGTASAFDFTTKGARPTLCLTHLGETAGNDIKSRRGRASSQAHARGIASFCMALHVMRCAPATGDSTAGCEPAMLASCSHALPQHLWGWKLT